jgi:hypothetical protein
MDAPVMYGALNVIGLAGMQADQMREEQAETAARDDQFLVEQDLHEAAALMGALMPTALATPLSACARTTAISTTSLLEPRSQPS